MTICTRIPSVTRVEDQTAAAPILAFIGEHQSALWHAARLIGGYEQARLVDRLVDILQQERRITKRARIMIDQLLALLVLDPVDDGTCATIGFFVPIDPEDPAVAEICLLTDGLRDAVDEVDRIRRSLAMHASRAA